MKKQAKKHTNDVILESATSFIKWITALGMLIAVLTASGALLFNVPFFTHAHDYFNLPLFGKTSLHTAMLFDLGVYLVVVGVTMTIIQTIGESD